MLREQAGEAEPDAHVALERGRPPRAPAAAPGADSRPRASTPSSTGASTASAAPRARATRTSSACAPARLADAPDAVLMPGTPGRARSACSRSARPSGRRGPVRRRHERGRRRRARSGGAFERLISLDLRRLRAVEIDDVSLAAKLGPGLRGPEAEKALAERGLPSATSPSPSSTRRSAGSRRPARPGRPPAATAASTTWSRRCAMATPEGELATLDVPHTAAGPSLRELAIGSEGALGVITEVGVRVRPAPVERRYEAWVVADFGTGREVVRALAQSGALPDVIRVSDEAETAASMGLAGVSERPQRRALEGYLRLRRRSGGCIADHGLGGHRRIGRAPTGRLRPHDPPRRRRLARARARRVLAAGPLRGPIPARGAARPRLSDRDARDRAHLVEPGEPTTSRRSRHRHRFARTRRRLRGHVPSVPRLPRRGLAVLHLHGPRARPAPSSSSGAR